MMKSDLLDVTGLVALKNKLVTCMIFISFCSVIAVVWFLGLAQYAEGKDCC